MITIYQGETVEGTMVLFDDDDNQIVDFTGLTIILMITPKFNPQGAVYIDNKPSGDRYAIKTDVNGILHFKFSAQYMKDVTCSASLELSVIDMSGNVSIVKRDDIQVINNEINAVTV